MANLMRTTEKDLRDHFSKKFSLLKKAHHRDQTGEIDQLRSNAMQAFTSRGFPTTKDEEYKYTPITKALLKSVKVSTNIPAEAGMVPPFGEHLIPGLDGYLMVFWNGKLVFKTDEIPRAGDY